MISECGARLHLAHPLGIKAFAYQRVSIPEFPYTQSGVFVHVPAHLVSEAAWRPTR